METKANYTLIGLFTLAGLIGIVGLFLWFARVELDRQFAYYDIRFTSVAGLSTASDVRFSGLPVGQVVDVRFSPERDGTITVRVEVVAETPVRTDSIATIEAQGVTGVSFVSIGPGTPSAQLLGLPADGAVPVLSSGRSMIQSLSEDAPALASETLRVVQDVGELFRGENAGRVDRILENAERASEDFARALDALSGVAETVDDFADQINRFNTTLEGLVSEFGVVLETADETLGSIDALAAQATGIVAAGTDTLAALEGTVIEAERYIANDLARATADVEATLGTIRAELSTLSTDARTLIETFSVTGATATARLEDAEMTLAQVDGLIASLDAAALAVEQAAVGLDRTVTEDGAPLLTEAREALASATDAILAIEAAAETDLPAIMADVRRAVADAQTVIARTGEDLSNATTGLPSLVQEAETTLTEVTDTFARANTTLAAIDRALDVGERTLSAAEGAFAGADRVVNEEITGLIDGLRETVARLNAAVDTVSEDLPAISDDVRAAAGAASGAFAEFAALVADAGSDVDAFTSEGLPLYTRLAQETRTLIANLDRLTQRISRNPAQFLLNRDVPEFRR